jgi:hypothetical protein
MNNPPDHLQQLPWMEVGWVAGVIRSELPHMPYGLEQELVAFQMTRTRHDAQRLANALRHYCGRDGLAKEVEDLLTREESPMSGRDPIPPPPPQDPLPEPPDGGNTGGGHDCE